MDDLVKWLNSDWLSNPVWHYLVVAGIIGSFLLLKKYISHYLAGLLFSLVSRVWPHLDRQSFRSLVARPLGTFLFVFVSIVALHKLNFPARYNVELYDYTLKRIFNCIGTIILLMAFTRLLLRSIDFIATILEKKASQTPDRTDDQLVVFFRDFFKVVILIIGFLLIFRFAFHLHIGNLLTGLSIIGAAVALALRESLENLIASFIIFFDKPFTQGDLVKVQQITGHVEKIGLRSTRIRTDQKSYVSVPNKQMVDSILDNLTLRTQLKGELRLHLPASTPIAKLQQAMDGMRKILSHRKVENGQVFLADITASALVVQIDYFTSPFTQLEFQQLKDELGQAVLQLLAALQIELAGASTEVRIKGNP